MAGLDWYNAATDDQVSRVAAETAKELGLLADHPALPGLRQDVVLPMRGWDQSWSVREMGRGVNILMVNSSTDFVLLTPRGLELVHFRERPFREDPLGTAAAWMLNARPPSAMSRMPVIPSEELARRFRFDPGNLRAIREVLDS